MSLTLDTNIIIYALERDAQRGAMAQRLLNHAIATNAIMPRQVLGELLNHAHKKKGVPITNTREVVGLLEQATRVIDTDMTTTHLASELAERHRLQYFDAVICTIARGNGASLLLTADMQDGFRLGALTIVNPFAKTNAALIERTLSS